MKACVFIFLLAACYVECRKLKVPLDKNANIAFINMEGGGAPTQNKPAQLPNPSLIKPASPPSSPVKTPVSPTVAPLQPSSAPINPTPTAKPIVMPSQIKPVPVNPKPVVNPITTPGPGSVKQLVNFYDSQGKASPIRPFSYSQAVKQG